MIEISQGDTIGRVTATLSDGTGLAILTGATSVAFEVTHLVRGVELAAVTGVIDDVATGATSFAVSDVSGLPIGVYLPIAVVTYPSGTARFPCDEFRVKLRYDGRQD